MPDVNLLRDTKQPEQAPASRPAASFDVTDPSAQPKSGLGSFFRSIFAGRPSSRPNIVAGGVPPKGKMSLQRASGQERILSETKTAPRSSVIPLPEDDGAFHVNLLSEELVSTFDPRHKIIQLALFALGAVAIVVAAYFGLRFYGTTVAKQVSSDQQTITQINQQIDALGHEQQTVATTTKKLNAVRNLIDRHVRWSRFFKQLERYTLPTVTYGTTFSGDIGGSMSLSASTNSFDEVAKQYLVFQQAVTNHDFITSFSISGASISKGQAGDRVAFTVNVTMVPELLENPPTTSTTP